MSTDGSIYTGSNCSSCPEGYYCPNLKQSAFQNNIDDISSSKSIPRDHPPIPCGSPSKYCPPNSTNPTAVNNGYYSIGGFGPNTRTNQVIAQKGHYAFKGELFQCPPGTFGDVSGLHSEDCSGLCHGGYYCPAGSISGDEIGCGRYQYCPEGSASPLVVREGFYTTIAYNESDYELQSVKPLKVEELECPKGHFCYKSVRYQCSAGTYGDKTRESSPNCTGFCEAGFYCRQGSTSSRESRCGNPSFYCPKGSKFPKVVEPGYYTLSDNDEPRDRKTQQLICPEGKFVSSDYSLFFKGLIVEALYCTILILFRILV